MASSCSATCRRSRACPTARITARSPIARRKHGGDPPDFNPEGEVMADLLTSTINLRILAAAVPFASKDETRYYLNGVCLEIEPRAVTYIATDGHRMIAYRDEKQDEDS